MRFSPEEIKEILNFNSTKSIADEVGLSQATVCKIKLEGGSCNYNMSTINRLSDHLYNKLLALNKKMSVK